jgi:putative component of membrane protein insertase Oxa1/YidC/SpoIIIJ protein YidD
MITAAALTAIRGYQRFLSPRKGYACADRLRHGGTGCSGYAKLTISDLGLICALPLIRNRFRACHAAAVAMDEARGVTPRKTTRERWWHFCDPSGCCDVHLCGRGRAALDTTPDGCDGTPDCSP